MRWGLKAMPTRSRTSLVICLPSVSARLGRPSRDGIGRRDPSHKPDCQTQNKPEECPCILVYPSNISQESIPTNASLSRRTVMFGFQGGESAATVACKKEPVISSGTADEMANYGITPSPRRLFLLWRFSLHEPERRDRPSEASATKAKMPQLRSGGRTEIPERTASSTEGDDLAHLHFLPI
jgi:hypothetical protein